MEKQKTFKIPTYKRCGVDLDGVLCLNFLDRKLYRPHKMNEFYSQGQYTGFASDLPIVIITARKERYRKTTEEWLRKNDICYSGLIMLPKGVKKNRETCLAHKAKFINELQLDIYFEDSPLMISGLKKLCPKTTIVDVT